MNTITQRPAGRDAAIILAACEKLAERLEQHYPNDFPASGRPDVVEDLRKAALNSYNHDGYRMGRELDSMAHWEVDSDMVELLDGYRDDLWEAQRTAVREWVRFYEIKPQLALGTKVMIPSVKLTAPFHSKESWECEIVQIDAEQATYTLFCERAGHVRDGVGTHGVILAFEYVEEMPR